MTRSQPATLGKAAIFKPQSSEDYVQYFRERTQIKSRRHENVVKEYGEFLLAHGHIPRTDVHPRDMTAERDGRTWLIEVKVVYNGNGVDATCEAFAQLFMYSDTFHAHDPDVLKLAVFSEPVGGWNVEFLQRYGDAPVWRHGDRWVGLSSAVAAGLAEN
jgi:hypothetical protein